MFTVITDGTWARLKTCRNERCQKAFYDAQGAIIVGSLRLDPTKGRARYMAGQCLG